MGPLGKVKHGWTVWKENGEEKGENFESGSVRWDIYYCACGYVLSFFSLVYCMLVYGKLIFDEKLIRCGRVLESLEVK